MLLDYLMRHLRHLYERPPLLLTQIKQKLFSRCLSNQPFIVSPTELDILPGEESTYYLITAPPTCLTAQFSTKLSYLLYSQSVQEGGQNLLINASFLSGDSCSLCHSFTSAVLHLLEARKQGGGQTQSWVWSHLVLHGAGTRTFAPG